MALTDNGVESTASWSNCHSEPLVGNLTTATKNEPSLPCSFAVELTLRFGQDEVPYPATLIEALKKLPDNALVYEINIQPGHTVIKCTKEDSI